MRLHTMWAVRFYPGSPGKKFFWVRFTEDGWEPIDLFCPSCLVGKQKALAFLQMPGLDSRYELWEIKLNAFVRKDK